MKESSELKKSHIILSIDPAPMPNLRNFVKKIIGLLQENICAIKLNFHIILPFSQKDLLEINKLAHLYKLQSIADIKLNDIASTNEIAIHYLLEMGFDSVIVNPFIGKNALRSAVQQTHKKNCGIIALIYMSHPGAKEGFGVNVINWHNNKTIGMYKLFLKNALEAKVDGIVVGATYTDILKEVSRDKKVPIYSPGLGKQGGNIQLAARHGTDYFIIGRSIIESRDPLKEAKKLQCIVQKL
jgi:orotidine-5'-phosphate decarboxylase